MLGTPGMVALDIDANIKGLLQQIVLHLENIPKPQGENISAITCDLSVCITYPFSGYAVLIYHVLQYSYH